MEKTVSEVMRELSGKKSSYKFAVYGGQAVIRVDGLMHSLSQ
ncbi:MAG: hypothetical protein ABH803_01555 [Candidatus Micrarchaeota archaeon]